MVQITQVNVVSAPNHGGFVTKGEDDLRNGPVSRRSCTDVLMLLIFIVFSLGMISIGIFAFHEGNPIRFVLFELFPTQSFYLIHSFLG